MLRVVFSNCLIWLAPMVLLAGLINSVPVPPASPCPGLFSYQYDSNRSEYYGLANLQSQQIKNTVEVEMSFSIAAQLPSVSSLVLLNLFLYGDAVVIKPHVRWPQRKTTEAMPHHAFLNAPIRYTYEVITSSKK